MDNVGVVGASMGARLERLMGATRSRSPHSPNNSPVQGRRAFRRARRPLFTGLPLAGCGSDVDVELVWAGPPDAATGGAVSTDGFSGFQQEVDEDWERSPAMAAAVFLRLDERKAVRTTIDAKAGPEGGGGQTVVVTLDGIPDDSVARSAGRSGSRRPPTVSTRSPARSASCAATRDAGTRTSQAKSASE